LHIMAALGSVAILGAGTQGRRLAYMVSLPLSASTEMPHPGGVADTNLVLDAFANIRWSIAAQWSSRGGAVHLIDRDAAQLQDAKLSVDKFRQSNALKNHLGGEVSLFAADNRRAAIEKAWLVVEVCIV
jgi:hypothetical protein